MFFSVCNLFKLWDVQTWADLTGILFDKPSQDLHNPRIGMEICRNWPLTFCDRVSLQKFHFTAWRDICMFRTQRSPLANDIVRCKENDRNGHLSTH